MLTAMEISEAEFHQIVDFVKNNYGVNLTEKRTLVNGRLSSLLMKSEYNTCSEYMDKVFRNPHGEEAVSLLNTLTTNHTFFLREEQHFIFLRDRVLPELKVSEQNKRDIGIWSAACSSGEEAYTIAMVLHDFFCLDTNRWDTTILATDISKKVLQEAESSVYDFESIKNLPDSWIRQYFQKTRDGLYDLRPEIKKQVIFRYFNLMEPFPFRRKFHIVFLRNVMIYFDEETKEQLLNKVYDAMEPGGYLFIGTTEIIDKSKSKFHYLQPSIYQK